MVFVLNVECRYFKLATPIFLIVSVFLLYIVMGIGSVTNGASRWISIFGIQFQPSELGKGALIMTIAQLLSAMQTDYGADRKAIKYILFVSGVVILPIFSENPVSYTHLRAHETRHDLVCRLLLEKKS